MALSVNFEIGVYRVSDANRMVSKSDFTGNTQIGWHRNRMISATAEQLFIDIELDRNIEIRNIIGKHCKSSRNRIGSDMGEIGWHLNRMAQENRMASESNRSGGEICTRRSDVTGNQMSSTLQIGS